MTTSAWESGDRAWRSEALLLAVTEGTPDAVYLKDLEGRYLQLNAAACRVLGKERDEVLGKDDTALFPAEDARRVMEGDRRVLAGGAPQTYEELITIGGEPRTFLSTKGPVRDPQGRVVGLFGIARDISGRRRADLVLQDSEERFRTLFENSPNGIFLTDPETLEIVDCNHIACRMNGYAREELVGRSINVLHPEEVARRMAGGAEGQRSFVAELRAKGVVTVESVHRRKDGSLFPLETSMCLLPVGGRTLVMGIDRDITERMQAERAVRDREQSLARIYDTVEDAIFQLELDEDGRYWFASVNAAFTAITGLTPAQVVGRRVDEVIPEPSRSMVLERYATAIRERRMVRWDETSDYPTGRLIGEVSIAPVFDDAGRCTHLVGSVHDITERQRAEEARRESEQKYRELVEYANSIILRWTRDGRIAFLNEFGQRFFGYTADEICGRHVLGTIVPETESSGRDLPSLMDRICADPAAYEQSVNENMRRTGERVWIAWTNRVVRDQQGNVAEILSVGEDITARKNAEDELRATKAGLERRVIERTAELAAAKERAESADRVKSAFLAAMSHELRTPLNSVIGFTGLLLQGLAGPLNAEQGKQLRMVKESGQHLLALINDVLDISKIEAGQVEIANAPFDLREAIEKVARTVGPLADRKQLPVLVQVAPGVGRLVSDRRRVEQVLLNLLSNAIKFTERGQVTVIAETAPGTVRISVADTGIGIKAEDLGKLFQPFRQLDTGLTRQHEGTGLGLAICRRLVERLGGTIAVESRPGQGSTFSVTLPVTEVGTP